jgi:hypothetical protein
LTPGVNDNEKKMGYPACGFAACWIPHLP